VVGVFQFPRIPLCPNPKSLLSDYEAERRNIVARHAGTIDHCPIEGPIAGVVPVPVVHRLKKHVEPTIRDALFKQGLPSTADCRGVLVQHLVKLAFFLFCRNRIRTLGFVRTRLEQSNDQASRLLDDCGVILTWTRTAFVSAFLRVTVINTCCSSELFNQIGRADPLTLLTTVASDFRGGCVSMVSNYYDYVSCVEERLCSIALRECSQCRRPSPCRQPKAQGCACCGKADPGESSGNHPTEAHSSSSTGRTCCRHRAT
jgi:hypothetical protein